MRQFRRKLQNLVNNKDLQLAWSKPHMPATSSLLFQVIWEIPEELEGISGLDSKTDTTLIERTSQHANGPEVQR